MNRPPLFRTVLAFGILVLAGWFAAAQEPKDAWSLSRLTENLLPVGWKVEATTPIGPLATWTVASDKTAPGGGGRVLAIISPNYDYEHDEDVFHLCWTDTIFLKNVDIRLSLKANSGNQDRGGGPIWRVLDKNNYYICRANPLEGNLCLYFVKDGKRKSIAKAKITMPSHQWQTIRIKHIDKHIECDFNGKKLIEADDDTFANAGGVGVWTKADAMVSFANLKVLPASPAK